MRSAGEHHLLLESYSPTDSTDFHRFYISRFPCSSVLSVGDSSAPNIRVNLRYLWENTICCLRLFSRRFHGYTQILYFSEHESHESLNLRSQYIIVKLEKLLPFCQWVFNKSRVLLRIQYPCKSVASVGDFSARCLRDVVPQIPRIFTDFIYPDFRAHPRYLWETPPHPISV